MQSIYKVSLLPRDDTSSYAIVCNLLQGTALELYSRESMLKFKRQLYLFLGDYGVDLHPDNIEVYEQEAHYDDFYKAEQYTNLNDKTKFTPKFATTFSELEKEVAN